MSDRDAGDDDRRDVRDRHVQLSVVVYQYMVTNILVVMTVWMIFVTPVVVLLGEQCKIDLSSSWCEC